MKPNLIYTCLAIAVILVGWGVTWANQTAKINSNRTKIDMLSTHLENVSSQTTEADKAIVRIETKLEYIIKGIDEIKAEVKGKRSK